MLGLGLASYGGAFRAPIPAAARLWSQRWCCCRFGCRSWDGAGRRFVHGPGDVDLADDPSNVIVASSPTIPIGDCLPQPYVTAERHDRVPCAVFVPLSAISQRCCRNHGFAPTSRERRNDSTSFGRNVSHPLLPTFRRDRKTCHVTDDVSKAMTKVPAVTLGFSVIKILATTLGETGGDTVTMTLNWGYAAGAVLFGVALVHSSPPKSSPPVSTRPCTGRESWPRRHSGHHRCRGRGTTTSRETKCCSLTLSRLTTG